MTRHAYPLRTLLADDARAVVGLLLTAGPLFLAGLAPVCEVVFAGLAVLFLVFAARSLVRHTRVIELSDTGVRVGGWFGRFLAWNDLTDLQLRYYSTRRDREAGWLLLRLSGRQRHIRIESSIAGFNAIARRTTHEALGRGVSVTAPTRSNLQSLGISVP
ncbi:MAG: hypothetical protein EXQ85_04795 [Alphaproteobacteria bacterium]|nr:hypothetical protein [Alphaproteobacteria bacterium]